MEERVMNKNLGKKSNGVRSDRRRAVIFALFLPVVILILALVQLAAANPDTAVASAGEEIITVTTTDDELNSDGDCSLREAIQAANTDSAVDACPAGSEADTVIVPAGTYTLTITGTVEDANATGDLDILDDLSLHGAGAISTTIDGGSLDRIFHVLTGTVDSRTGGGLQNSARFGGVARMTVHNVDILGNTATNQYGGFGWGGGLSNGAAEANSLAVLTVTNSLISGNQAIGTGDYSDGIGGGITNVTYQCSTCVAIAVIRETTIRDNSADNVGGIASTPYDTTGTPTVRLTLDRSTINGNTSHGTDIIDKGLAGGMMAGGGTTRILNSTISGNSATGSSGGISGWGGGILVGSNFGLQASVSISNTTVASNTASANGGGIAVTKALGSDPDPIVNLANSIVADNISTGSQSCHDPFLGISSLGYNLEDADLCGFDQSTDLVDTDPLLEPLENNGGQTETQALSWTSPALDQGSCPGVSVDQRGYSRPVDIASITNADDGCDIGAFELNPLYVYLPIILTE
jgi:CSLREA domain-containing protein